MWQKTIGHQLYMLRQDRRESLRTVAGNVHVNYTDISKIERGERPGVTFDAIYKLARYYGSSIGSLLGES